MNLLKQFINIFKYRFNLDEDKAAEADVVESITKGIEFKGINLWTLIFAILIASIGLNVNSTAVIIGAMLISPLMGPIMGIGLGAGVFDFELIKKAGKNLLIASVIGLLTSTLYFLISPLHQAQSELLARTSPTIWDVLIAFFGGLAGIVASSRKKYNNVIPGVAIATALMPPLCTAGYGLATAQWSYFFGASYLFIINSVFISISTFLIVRFLKFRSVSYVDTETEIKVKRWVGIIAIFTILPSIYLAYLFVKDEIFTQNAKRLITEEMIVGDYTVLEKDIDPKKSLIRINILGDKKVGPLKRLLDLKKQKYGLEDALILVKSGDMNEGNEESLKQLKEGIIEDLFMKQEKVIEQKNQTILNLERENQSQILFNSKKEEAIAEFYALYGQPQELVIERTVLHALDKQNDTILMVYISSKNRTISKSIDQIDAWLKTKFNLKKTKVILQ